MKILQINLKLEATKGDKTIANSDMFSYIDSDFDNYETNKKGNDTEATGVAILEIEKDSTFKKMYRDYDLDKACMTQGQIMEFLKKHRDKLCKDWYTFFLFKVGEEFFVAHVDVYDGGLGVCAGRFSDDCVWYALCRHRVVVPQLALDSLGNRPLDTLPLDLRVKSLEEDMDKLKKFLII